MIIGLPKEIKNNENRVGLTPTGVHALTGRGHRVLVEKAAGAGSNIEDEQYIYAGAEIMEDKGKIFSQSELIIKVKEPLEPEFELFKEGQILYTYLHLASNRLLTEALLNKRVSGIAYETVQLSNGQLPLLMPMSEVAGRMSVQIGANLLQKYNGGLGILLGGVPGVAPAQVVIIGGGVVGTNAAKIAVGMGAGVTILDVNRLRLVQIEDQFGGRVTTLVSNEHNLSESVKSADLLIGAVLLVGAKSPKIVTEGMVKTMKKGSVIVDVAIDQGGCIETIDHITTHDHSYYERHGVIHYSVANIPGAVPRTSTFALEAATLPYLLKIAEKGMEAALLADKALLSGLNTFKGHLTCQPVAESFNLAYKDPLTLLHA